MLLGAIDCTRSDGASIFWPRSIGSSTASAESYFVMELNRLREWSSLGGVSEEYQILRTIPIPREDT